MSILGYQPKRGERNSKGIYVYSDLQSPEITFIDLSHLGTSPVTRSQFRLDWYSGGNCAFMDDNTAICSADYEEGGNLYKYDLTNDYFQLKIVNSRIRFGLLLVTREKQILAAYRGCIYMYTSSGTYINKSDNSKISSIHQMKEFKSNIIITTEADYVYLHNINNASNTINHKLLDKADTQTVYYTIEVLSENTGNIALGGYTNTSGTQYGYVELFHLDECNANLSPISHKRWIMMDVDCYIYIIREIQIGVLIFGGDHRCADICTWEYATIPHKDPTCFPIGGINIMDIISLP